MMNKKVYKLFKNTDESLNVPQELNFYISSCLCQHYRQFPKILSHDETALTINGRSGFSLGKTSLAFTRLEDKKRDAKPHMQLVSSCQLL